MIKLNKYYKEPVEKYNVLSVALFRMPNPYKNTKIYYDGLKDLVRETAQFYPEWRMRIYFDESVITKRHENPIIRKEVNERWRPFLKELLKSKHVQLVQFTVDAFYSAPFHDGIFGMFMRFIPLFDFKENRNVKDVYICDIDETSAITRIKRIYPIFKKSNSQFHYGTKLCYGLTGRLLLTGRPEYPKTICNMIMCKIKLPRRLLIGFFKKVLRHDPAVMKAIDVLKGTTMTTRGDILEPTHIKYIYYGLDEYFMNTDVMAYLIDNHIKMSISYSFQLTHMLFYILGQAKSDTYRKLYMRLIKDTDMGKMLNGRNMDQMTTKELYNVIDKEIYEKESSKAIQQIINVLENILKTRTWDQYNLTKDHIVCAIIYRKPYDLIMVDDYVRKYKQLSSID